MAREVTTGQERRWRLRDERDFLVRSLRDADLEHEAGDLSDADHLALTERDAERLKTVEAALADADISPSHLAQASGADAQTQGTAPETEGGRRAPDQLPTADRPPSAIGRRRRRNLLGVTGALVIVAAIVILVVQLASPRLPGESSSGSVQLSRAEKVQRQLVQAATLVNKGKLARALTLYQEVLGEEPGQPQALAERGWIEYEAGVETRDRSLIASGRSSVEASVRAQPGGYAGHLYLGTIVLQQDHDPAGAVAQFRLFLSEDPPSSLVRNAAQFLRQAFTQDGQPVPPELPPS